MANKCCVCGKEFGALETPVYIRNNSHPLCGNCYKKISVHNKLSALMIAKEADPKIFADAYIASHEAIERSGFLRGTVSALQEDLDQTVEDYYNRHPGFKEAVENSPAFTGEIEVIRYCPGCGAKGNPGALFCEKCGQAFEPVVKRNSSPTRTSAASNVPAASHPEGDAKPAESENQTGRTLSILGIAAVVISLFLPLANITFFAVVNFTFFDFMELTDKAFIWWIIIGLLIALIGFGTNDKVWTIIGALVTGAFLLYAAGEVSSDEVGHLVHLDIGFYTYLIGCLLMLAGGLMMPASKHKDN